MADSILYLFDGYNLLHAGEYEDARELRDALASFVALKGARGVLVFDGAGADETHGPLEIRFAENADTLLERLAVRGTSGQTVQKISSRTFLGDLEAVEHSEDRPRRIRDRLDPATREALERMRRGES